MSDKHHSRRFIHLRTNAALTIGIIATVGALGASAYVLGISSAQAQSETVAVMPPPLPMPQLPAIGSSFPELTPKGQIVTVQSPPIGKGEALESGHWITGTPEQVAASTSDLVDNRFHRPELRFPSTGTIKWYHRVPSEGTPFADLTFADQLGDGQSKLVRIRTESGEMLADVYLNGGETRLALPLGRYRLGLAVGRRWEGSETLFGPYGTYYEIDAMELSEPAEVTRYTRVIGVAKPSEAAPEAGQL
jgi:hypothetical protein